MTKKFFLTMASCIVIYLGFTTWVFFINPLRVYDMVWGFTGMMFYFVIYGAIIHSD